MAWLGPSEAGPSAAECLSSSTSSRLRRLVLVSGRRLRRPHPAVLGRLRPLHLAARGQLRLLHLAARRLLLLPSAQSLDRGPVASQSVSPAAALPVHLAHAALTPAVPSAAPASALPGPCPRRPPRLPPTRARSLRLETAAAPISGPEPGLPRTSPLVRPPVPSKRPLLSLSRWRLQQSGRWEALFRRCPASAWG